MMKNWIKSLKNQALADYAHDYKEKIKNRCYLFIMLAKIEKLNLFDKFMIDFPQLIENKIDEILNQGDLTLGYKKLLC